tara:strand:+ start:5653 stop:6135 length:483 start_codon:yes stop_codon:yes gene_type:complete
MKILHIVLIFFLWNTTYRCKKDELTIDCNETAKKMIGTWTGSQSNNAKTFSDSFTLKVTSSDGCTFFGETSYSQSITTFSVVGSIDEYGWIKFSENFYVVDGGEYSNCIGSGWSSPCRTVRWRPGAVFDEVRFNEETISGEWGISCWRCELVGGFTLFKE